MKRLCPSRRSVASGWLTSAVEVLSAKPQLAVEREREVRAQAQVEEEPGRGQDDRHRDGERGGDPNADRQPTHAPPSGLSR